MINKKFCIRIMKKFMKDCHVEHSRKGNLISFNIVGVPRKYLPNMKKVKYKQYSTFLTKRDENTCSIIVTSFGSLPKNHAVYQEKHIEGLTADGFRLATKEELFEKYQDEIIEYYLKKFNRWIEDVKHT